MRLNVDREEEKEDFRCLSVSLHGAGKSLLCRN